MTYGNYGNDGYNNNQYQGEGYGNNQGYDNNQYQNQGYDNNQYQNQNQGYEQPRGGEAEGYDGERGFMSGAKNYFTEPDGEFDKSHIALAGAGALATGLVGKKLYEHFTKDEKGRPQEPKFYDANGQPIHHMKDHNGQLIEQPMFYADGSPVEPSIMDKLRKFYRDDDGSLDKSNIFWAIAGTAGAGFAGKKLYEHFSKDEEGRPQSPKFYDANGQKIHQMKDDNGQLIEQPMYYADGAPVEPSVKDKLRKFYRDDDGSLDKSNIFWALAGTAAAGYAGKKVYDHYQKEENDQYNRPPQVYDANGQQVNLQGGDSTVVEQQLYNADGTPVEHSMMDKIRKFYRDDDGSVDKSNVFWTLAGTAAAGFIGKKAYDHYKGENEEGRSRGFGEDNGEEGRSRGFGGDDNY
ncbi:hypothetical protein LPJ53_002971 [Coemansia erecta]|uniref:Uncharacterized protein n=1 Tax=Coemansia erecta TaxID=147472 RepID=A0A9W7Y266_9FUNG|nr:hypothetical protein LPJ53_002971 [Coemansia erecta]